VAVQDHEQAAQMKRIASAFAVRPMIQMRPAGVWLLAAKLRLQLSL